MKASEYVVQLIELIREHGDLRVTIEHRTGGVVDVKGPQTANIASRLLNETNLRYLENDNKREPIDKVIRLF